MKTYTLYDEGPLGLGYFVVAMLIWITVVKQYECYYEEVQSIIIVH